MAPDLWSVGEGGCRRQEEPKEAGKAGLWHGIEGLEGYFAVRIEHSALTCGVRGLYSETLKKGFE